MRRIAVSLVVLTCAGFGTCAGLSAKAEPNLLFNPGFDDISQLDGWTNTAPSGLEVVWEPAMDRLGALDSGAARLTTDSASSNFFGRVTQCVEITPDAEIEFGSWLFVPAGQGTLPVDSSFGLRVIFYSSSDCSGQGIPTGFLNWQVTDQWHFLGQTSALPGAQSAEAQLVLGKAAAGGSFTALTDDISLRMAAFSSEDSPFGAETITRDNATGLGWLDVTFSTPFTYDEIVLELAPGGAFEGYRLATSDELLEFWENAGINIDPGFFNQFTTENFLPIVDLMALVSVTGEGNLGGGNFFDATSGYIESVPDSRGFITAGVLAADPDPTLTARPSFGFSSPDNVNPSHGSFLVLVPEPEADVLALTALAVVAFLVRKRTSSSLKCWISDSRSRRGIGKTVLQAFVWVD